MGSTKSVDVVIIGGGFFGCRLAIQLKKYYKDIVILERESDLLQRASYANQARVHNGYHYPRHFLTAIRSRVNFPRFVEEFRDCVYDDFEKFYAIGRKFSKTTATQFRFFVERVGSPIERAPEKIRKLFNNDLIEDVFTVREYAFDAKKLRVMLHDELDKHGIEVLFHTSAERVSNSDDRVEIEMTDESGVRSSLAARQAFNCTYSNINSVLNNSSLPLIPLKHEITEMALVELPDELTDISVTVMCGPFFSFMPFPSRKLSTLSHVRYTPHCHWYDNSENFQSPLEYFDKYPRKSNYEAIIRDSCRFIPSLSKCRYHDSLWEVKTTLPTSEVDDGRPILSKRDHGLKGLTHIMGGKIDNVYDVAQEIEQSFGARP